MNKAMNTCENYNWVLNEIKTADLKDKRLDKRLGNILEMLAKKPDASIPAKSDSWGEIKAAYRFFDNEAVSLSSVLSPHIDASIERIKLEKVVLLPQDTSELNYSSKQSTTGLGKLHYENHKGVLLHPTIAVTPERICLGVVDANFHVREDLGKDNQYRLPIEDKESVRWLNGYRIANKIAQLAPDTTIISIGDRESDIYEIFVDSKANVGGAHWIVRSSRDRCLAGKEGKLRKKLKEAVAIGTVEFEMVRTPKRQARRVKQELRAVSIKLRSPYRPQAIKINENYPTLTKNNVVLIDGELKFFDGNEFHSANIMNLNKSQKDRLAKLELKIGELIDRKLAKALFPVFSELNKPSSLPQATINAVMASEIETPNGEDPINWILLTSLPISSSEECLQVVEWYLCRWQIEVFFKVLKDGCKVEELQLQTLDRLTICIGLYLIISWRILYMTMLGRAYPNLPCAVVFATEEWQAAYMMTYHKPAPPEPPTLADMIRMVAGFGGFLKRKHDKNPGTQSLWIGLQRVKVFAAGIELRNELNNMNI